PGTRFERKKRVQVSFRERASKKQRFRRAASIVSRNICAVVAAAIAVDVVGNLHGGRGVERGPARRKRPGHMGTEERKTSGRRRRSRHDSNHMRTLEHSRRPRSVMAAAALCFVASATIATAWAAPGTDTARVIVKFKPRAAIVQKHGLAKRA